MHDRGIILRFPDGVRLRLSGIRPGEPLPFPLRPAAEPRPPLRCRRARRRSTFAPVRGS